MPEFASSPKVKVLQKSSKLEVNMLQAVWRRAFTYEGNLANLEDLRGQLAGRLALLLVGASGSAMLLYLPQEHFSIIAFGLLTMPLALGLNVPALINKHPALARYLLVWGLVADLTAAMVLISAPWLPFLGLLLTCVSAIQRSRRPSRARRLISVSH